MPALERSLRRKLAKAIGQAIAEFAMIAEGDRILCAVSGGKDSYVLHELLADLVRRAPVRFELIAVNIDQGHPGYPREVLSDYMAAQGQSFHMVSEDTYSIVKSKIPEGKTTCSLCSRLRRGILYSTARELGCNKIALGHHRDDVIVTLMLNLMFAGQLKAMPPKLQNDAGDLIVIRPLAYCAEDDIARYAQLRAYPIVPCGLCAEQESQRARVSALLAELERHNPGLRGTLMTAIGTVKPTHLLDTSLLEALGLEHAVERHDEESRDQQQSTQQQLAQLGPGPNRA